jgi:hypothetical protein
MAHNAYLGCLLSTVTGCYKNTLGRASAINRHIAKLEQFTFLIYLWEARKLCLTRIADIFKYLVGLSLVEQAHLS